MDQVNAVFCKYKGITSLCTNQCCEVSLYWGGFLYWNSVGKVRWYWFEVTLYFTLLSVNFYCLLFYY